MAEQTVIASGVIRVDASGRRQYSVEYKRRLAKLALEPGASVAGIALAHRINANQLFKWRQDYLRQPGEATAVTEAVPEPEPEATDGAIAHPGPAGDAAGRDRLAAAGADRAVAGGVSVYHERMTATDGLPDDIPALKAVLFSQRAEIAHLKLWIAKLRRQQFGRRSERAGNLLDQLELHLKELETGATELAVRLEPAVPPPSEPKTRTLPAHLPREVQLHHPETVVCPACGGSLKPLGEDVSELLEYVPSYFRVIRHVRPKHAPAAAATGSCKRPLARAVRTWRLRKNLTH